MWVFDINDLDEKGVKTEAGKRIVPIHPALVELGILERADYLKQQGHERLFPKLELRPSTDKYSGAVGQWFTRHRRTQGVEDEDPKTKLKKAFHSFRHTVVSAFQVAEVSRAKYQAVVGHEGKDGDVTDLYEHGYPVSVLYEDVICKLNFSEAIGVQGLAESE